jgi:hypothetical protein
MTQEKRWIVFMRNGAPNELHRCAKCRKCQNITEQRQCLLDNSKWQCMQCGVYMSADSNNQYSQSLIMKTYHKKMATKGVIKIFEGP